MAGGGWWWLVGGRSQLMRGRMNSGKFLDVLSPFVLSKACTLEVAGPVCSRRPAVVGCEETFVSERGGQQQRRRRRARGGRR
eukprot:COSAG01_NODE_14455_length_1451_cov_13.113166_1_plen_81_part_10